MGCIQKVNNTVIQANDLPYLDLEVFLVNKSEYSILFYFPIDIWKCLKFDFEKLKEEYDIEIIEKHEEYAHNFMDMIPRFNIQILGYYLRLDKNPF